MAELAGTPIDDQPPPEWAELYLSKDQLRLGRLLQWILLIYESRGLGAPAVSVAQRIYVSIHTRSKAEPRKTWLSMRTLAADLDMASTNTVSAALRALEQRGWIVSRPRTPNGLEYLPAWPIEDGVLDHEGPDRCGSVGKTGDICTRRAGWGTGSQSGPCKLHRDRP